MQGLAFEFGDNFQRLLGRVIGWPEARYAGAPIKRVANERVPNMAHMHPDLMGPSGLEATFDKAGQRIAIELRAANAVRGDSLEMGDGLFPLRAVKADDRHLFSVPPRTGQGPIDCAHCRARAAMHDGEIGALNIVGLPLGGKALMGLVILGDDHDARGFFVEPMHNARADHPANAGERVAAMVEQGVDQRAGPIACSRVDDQPGGLIDDDEIPILKQHVERDILGFGRWVLRWRRRQGEVLPLAHFPFRISKGISIFFKGTAFNQRFDARTAKVLGLVRDPFIEPGAVVVWAGRKVKGFSAHEQREVRCRGLYVKCARMTDQMTPTPTAPSGPNLMLLKGIVWGLGVLLILGFALVAAIIAMGPRDVPLAATLELPLQKDETILAADIANGELTTFTSRDGLPHRIMIIDMRTNELTEIPVKSASDNGNVIQ